MSQKALIVFWDDETNVVTLSKEGLFCFDVAGLLAVALELAADEIPTMQYETEDEDAEDL